MIRTVIFDYGGVVTDGGGGGAVDERLASRLDITIDRASQLLKGTWGPLVRGESTEEDFWQKLETAFKKPIPEDRRDIFMSWDDMQPRPQILKLIGELKQGGYTVGLLSNVIPRSEEFLRTHGVYELFDPCILSCKLGLAKPDKDIYDKLLNALGDVEPSTVLYIDDQERCLIPARELGLQTVLAGTGEQTAEAVRALMKLRQQAD